MAEQLCGWCGGEKKEERNIYYPCKNTHCYTGCVALVDGNGNVEYEHRDTVRQHIAATLLSITKFPDELIDICVELSCCVGRWNPTRLEDEDAYVTLMHEALEKCEAVQTQLDIRLPGHSPTVKAEVRAAVLEAICSTEYDPMRQLSWFDEMCNIYISSLDRSFACKAGAMEAAEAVWNTGSYGGESIRSFVARIAAEFTDVRK
jgi:hypothetical protein